MYQTIEPTENVGCFLEGFFPIFSHASLKLSLDSFEIKSVLKSRPNMMKKGVACNEVLRPVLHLAAIIERKCGHLKL